MLIIIKRQRRKVALRAKVQAIKIVVKIFNKSRRSFAVRFKCELMKVSVIANCALHLGSRFLTTDALVEIFSL